MANILITTSTLYLLSLFICGICYCIYKVHKCNFFCTSPEERVEWILLKHNLTKNSSRCDRGRRVNKAIVDLDILISKTKHTYAKKVYRKARLGLLIDKNNKTDS